MFPKGILFDLDDTIISYSSVAERTWRNVCRAYVGRYNLGEADIAELIG